jgi:hypothetical protein
MVKSGNGCSQSGRLVTGILEGMVLVTVGGESGGWLDVYWVTV